MEGGEGQVQYHPTGKESGAGFPPHPMVSGIHSNAEGTSRVFPLVLSSSPSPPVCPSIFFGFVYEREGKPIGSEPLSFLSLPSDLSFKVKVRDSCLCLPGPSAGKKKKKRQNRRPLLAVYLCRWKYTFSVVS